MIVACPENKQFATFVNQWYFSLWNLYVAIKYDNLASRNMTFGINPNNYSNNLVISETIVEVAMKSFSYNRCNACTLRWQIQMMHALLLALSKPTINICCNKNSNSEQAIIDKLVVDDCRCHQNSLFFLVVFGVNVTSTNAYHVQPVFQKC